MPNYTWSPLILTHAACAGSAVLLGACVLWRRKGDSTHRWLGRAWVLLMATTALLSFGIHRQSYSWIHGLSVFTLIMLALGVVAARQGRVRLHRRIMSGTYLWALMVTGLFTLLPNRLLGHELYRFFGWVS